MQPETAIYRKIDDLGRIVIPAEFRRWFKINEGDELHLFVDKDDIIIRKVVATCMLCGSTEKVTKHRDRGVCQSCRRELVQEKIR